MHDILQLRITPDEFVQLRLCQLKLPQDCHAAFTVRAAEMIWPTASWGEMPVEERINVRGWSSLLDRIADEFLIWRPKGGCFFVAPDGVRYRVEERNSPGVIFLQFDLSRLMAVPARQPNLMRADSAN